MNLAPLAFIQDVYVAANFELFCVNEDDQITGAEKITFPLPAKDDTHVLSRNGLSLHIETSDFTCRERLATEMNYISQSLKPGLKNAEQNITFWPMVKTSPTGLKGLKNIIAKYPPTKNFYGLKSQKVKNKSISISQGAVLRLKNAEDNELNVEKYLADENFVAVLDAIVGNTCVLLDRNPANVEWRKTTGKAGDFRFVATGVEYCVLSQFWLRNYALLSLVTGLARFAVHVFSQNNRGQNTNYLDTLNKLVKRKDIVQAIQKNDFNLAKRNFEKLIPFIVSMAGTENDNYYPLTRTTIKQFRHFIDMGLDYWFKENPLRHWETLTKENRCGIENFLLTVVNNDMLDNRKKLVKRDVNNLWKNINQ